jgi:hypothetical protein
LASSSDISLAAAQEPREDESAKIIPRSSLKRAEDRCCGYIALVLFITIIDIKFKTEKEEESSCFLRENKTVDFPALSR